MLLGTGAELRLPRRRPGKQDGPPRQDAKSNEVFVEVQVFADVEDDGRRYRIGGTVQQGEGVRLSDDPTTALLRIAQEARQLHLGNLLGDLRRSGSDITRFDWYAAPFRIELAQDLRERLRGSWRDDPPSLALLPPIPPRDYPLVDKQNSTSRDPPKGSATLTRHISRRRRTSTVFNMKVALWTGVHILVVALLAFLAGGTLAVWFDGEAIGYDIAVPGALCLVATLQFLAVRSQQ